MSFLQRYIPTRVLGEGGYGKVWLVHRITDGVLCAAKVIDDIKCRNKAWCPNRAKQIPDEILILESLDHSCIIDIHETYLEQNCWIIVMDYLQDFVDLWDHIYQNGALSVEDAREVLAQLLGVCSYLISQDIDHRDIKAENILYNPATRRIKLVDFDCASLIPDSPYTVGCHCYCRGRNFMCILQSNQHFSIGHNFTSECPNHTI